MKTLLAAIVVTLLLLPCFASAGTPVSLDAATRAIKTEGGKLSEVEGGWNLWSNGEVGDYFLFKDVQECELSVIAYGSPCQGDWPLMSLMVDGETQKTVTVGSKTFASYKFPLQLSPGVHQITVAFINDMQVGKEDRNLYLKGFELKSDTTPPALATPEQWMAECLKREQFAIDQSAAAIEKYRKGDISVQVVDPDGKAIPGAKVSVEMVSHEFLFGCNIFMFDRFKTEKENAAYKQAFANLFNYATVGFYWRWYEHTRGKPQYEYTDKVVSWCTSHGIRMKGHPLLWGNEAGVPTWSKGQPSSEQQKARVIEIMQRYAGKIGVWEVVNEPAHEKAVPIDPAYRWARQADANAYLIVNDYYVMANGFPPFYQLLEKSKADGLPFDGIGIQAHEPHTMRFPLGQVQRVLDTYAKLSKDLHITEFTPASSGEEITGSPITGKWDEKAQEDYAVKFYRTCFAHPSVAGITWWDLCDDGAWLKGGGMLHKDLSPKPVYTALRKLIHEEWWTRSNGETNAAGKFATRGFLGRYVVTATAGGKTVKAEFALSRQPSVWTIRM